MGKACIGAGIDVMKDDRECVKQKTAVVAHAKSWQGVVWTCHSRWIRVQSQGDCGAGSSWRPLERLGEDVLGLAL
jgi:hypothetical protein